MRIKLQEHRKCYCKGVTQCCRCVCWELDQPPELRCSQTSLSSAAMLYHVGRCFLLGYLLLDLDGFHVQGQSRQISKVLSVFYVHTHTELSALD